MDTYITAHASYSSIVSFYLVKIDFSGGSVYWTTADIPIVALGQRWTPKTIRVGGITSRQGEIAGEATIDLGDADQSVSAYVLGATSPVGTPVHIYDAWLDNGATSTIAQGTKLIYEGRIGKPTADRRDNVMTGRFMLAPYADFRSKKVPRRWMGPKCPFQFMGTLCGSNGSDTTCDRTFTSCSQPTKKSGSPVGGNRERFGGFLGIPPDGYVIAWGDGTFVLRSAPKKNSNG